MTWIILQLAFPLVVIGIAFHLYRNNRSLLIGFREQLAVSPKGRRFIVLVALLGLIVYHFIALCGTANPLELLPSSILGFLLFSQRFGEGIVRIYQSRRWNLLLLVITLAMFFHSATTPLAVTQLVLLITSWIYPTEELMKEVSERGDTTDIIEETIEGLQNEIENAGSTIFFEKEENEETADDVDSESAPKMASEETEDAEEVSDAAPSSSMPSEKAIRKQKMREKERERRHSRAKRRARRARNGH